MQTLAAGPGVGEVVGGRHRIDALLGGGYGSVYRATQLNLGRVVALELLHPGLFSAEGAHERFCREAELAQQLRHPNTVRLYDFGRTDAGLPYIVWELLEGQPLDQLVAREGRLPVQRVIRIATQVLEALMKAQVWWCWLRWWSAATSGCAPASRRRNPSPPPPWSSTASAPKRSGAARPAAAGSFRPIRS